MDRPLKVTFRREYIDNYLPISDTFSTNGDGETGTGTAAGLPDEAKQSRWGKLRGARLFGTFGGGAKPKVDLKVPAAAEAAAAGLNAGPRPNKFRSGARKLMLVNKLRGAGDDDQHGEGEPDPRDREAGKHAWKFRDKVIEETDTVPSSRSHI